MKIQGVIVQVGRSSRIEVIGSNPEYLDIVIALNFPSGSMEITVPCEDFDQYPLDGLVDVEIDLCPEVDL